jgi:hypothetical protein
MAAACCTVNATVPSVTQCKHGNSGGQLVQSFSPQLFRCACKVHTCRGRSEPRSVETSHMNALISLRSGETEQSHLSWDEGARSLDARLKFAGSAVLRFQDYKWRVACQTDHALIHAHRVSNLERIVQAQAQFVSPYNRVRPPRAGVYTGHSKSTHTDTNEPARSAHAHKKPHDTPTHACVYHAQVQVHITCIPTRSAPTRLYPSVKHPSIQILI